MSIRVHLIPCLENQNNRVKQVRELFSHDTRSPEASSPRAPCWLLLSLCSIILNMWPVPSCSQNGCCISRLHICIPGRKKGRRKLTFANWLLLMLRETNFLEVPSCLELGHVATTGCKGAWELSTSLLWTKLGIPKVQEEGESGHGKAANSRRHNLLASVGNKSFHIKSIFLVTHLFLWARKYILIIFNGSRRHMPFLWNNLMTFFPTVAGSLTTSIEVWFDSSSNGSRKVCFLNLGSAL